MLERKTQAIVGARDGRESAESTKQIRPFVLILVTLGTGKNNPPSSWPLAFVSLVSLRLSISGDSRLSKRPSASAANDPERDREREGEGQTSGNRDGCARECQEFYFKESRSPNPRKIPSRRPTIAIFDSPQTAENCIHRDTHPFTLSDPRITPCPSGSPSPVCSLPRRINGTSDHITIAGQEIQSTPSRNSLSHHHSSHRC